MTQPDSRPGRPGLRPYQAADWRALWAVLEPIFRRGDVYAFPADITESEVHALWVERPVATWLAEDHGGDILGAYYLKPNQMGGGSHVCNAGYAVADRARGRGVAALMCEHSQQEAVRLGFRSMQFNFVVASNEAAVHLWTKLGFETVGRLPQAFRHPALGYVDALVMFKHLYGQATPDD